jgi:outer membrane protein OmpA-like peptidoglycan-associated protein
MRPYFSNSNPINAAAVGVCFVLISSFAQAAEDSAPSRDPLPTKRGSFVLKLEPGLAIPLTDPQSHGFDFGGVGTAKGLFALTPYLDLGPSVSFLALPTDDSLRDLGTAWTVGGSIQVKRPHDISELNKSHIVSPWADFDALYVRTGKLDRFGFAVGAGLSVSIGKSRVFWLGPLLRYFQIVQPERSGFNNDDAKILIVGISLEVGAGAKRAPVIAGSQEVRVVNKDVYSCPDRDKDGVPDVVDRCPDAVGTIDNWGCPPYKKVVVKLDRIELKERLYFAWDQAVLQDVSFPILDEVVQVLNDNKRFRVQIDGHASSEGAYDHNMTLSEQRAAAVLDYLVSHGINKDRLISKGFGSSVPADTNETVEGRENNRRVEFIVNFNILNEGSK